MIKFVNQCICCLSICKESKSLNQCDCVSTKPFQNSIALHFGYNWLGNQSTALIGGI